MNLETYSNKIINFLKDENEGLYNYYETRINKNNIFNDDDLNIINYFNNNVNKDANIIEIAAGIGQVSHYLNKNGYSNITINEHDIKRFNLSKNINNYFNNNCTLINNKYQNITLDKYDYIFTINAVSSHMNNDKGICNLEKTLNNNSKIIIKEGYFGTHNDTFITDYLKNKYKYKILFATDSPVYLFN